MSRKRVTKKFTQPSMTESQHAYGLHTPNLIRRYVVQGEALENVNGIYGEQPTQEDYIRNLHNVANWNSDFEELPQEEKAKYDSPMEWVSQKLYEASQGEDVATKGGTSGESTPSADGDVSPPEESLDDS